MSYTIVEFKSDIVKIFKVAAKEKRTEEKLIEVKKPISKSKREVKISRIKYFHINDQLKILNFGKDISINMLITLWNKFGLNKRDIGDFVRNNRNLGIFLNLIKRDIVYSDDWKRFIDLVIPKKKSMSKSDNILVAKDYSMLLLVTERKLLSEDLKNLNKIIFRINVLIKEHNNKNFGFQTQTIIR